MIRVELELSVPNVTDAVLTISEAITAGAPLREVLGDLGAVVHRLTVEEDDA